MSIWASRTFYSHSDVDLDVKVFIGSLQLRIAPSYDEYDQPSEFSLASLAAAADGCYISLQVIDGGIPLHPFARSTVATSVVLDEEFVNIIGSFRLATSTLTWNEWVALPIKISQLTQSSQLIVRVWSIDNTCIAGASLRLFDDKSLYLRGVTPITIWNRNVTEKQFSAISKEINPDTTQPLSLFATLDGHYTLRKSIERLILKDDTCKLELPWCDRLLLEQAHKELLSYSEESIITARRKGLLLCMQALHSKSEQMVRQDKNATNFDKEPLVPLPYTYECLSDVLIMGTLEATFPILPHQILWEDTHLLNIQTGINGQSEATATRKPGFPPLSPPMQAEDTIHSQVVPPLVFRTSVQEASIPRGHDPGLFAPSSHTPIDTLLVSLETPQDPNRPVPLPMVDAMGNILPQVADPAVTYWGERLNIIADPGGEDGMEHPAEHMAHRLARGNEIQHPDSAPKPNKSELAMIQMAISSQSLSLTVSAEIRDLFWKYRYSLIGNKRAIIKFAASIDGNDEADVQEAESLIANWVPCDVEDALRLLLPEFQAGARILREYAVRSLRLASTDDIGLFLLQLVQALRYEPQLQHLLGGNSKRDGFTPILESQQLQNPRYKEKETQTAGRKDTSPSITPQTGTSDVSSETAQEVVPGGSTPSLSPLADFLITKASTSLSLASDFYWYLEVECADLKWGALFTAVRTAFFDFLDESDAGREVKEALLLQIHTLKRIEEAQKIITQARREKVETKEKKLSELFSDGKAFDDVANMQIPVSLPTNTHVRVSGVVRTGFKIFRSAMYPIVMTFKVHPTARIPWWEKNLGVCGVTVLDQVRRTAAECIASMDLSTSANPTDLIARKEPAGKRNIDSNVPVVLSQDSSHSEGVGNAHSIGESSRQMVKRVVNAFSLPSRSPLTRTTKDNEKLSYTPSQAGGATSFDGSSASRDTEHEKADAKQKGKNTQQAASNRLVQAISSAVQQNIPPATYRLIFKTGDDMRQDQLIIQMIRLMDMQLKKYNLDLCLTPYSVMALSNSSGVMEMVLESEAFSAVVKKHGSNPVQGFFRTYAPNPDAPFGICPKVMETYVKSCAGYAVVTYLLGVGDRHLDNIMIAKTGHLFHIDFGYILGRDPKPLPPPMRLTGEMVNGMGPENYQRFRSLACAAFNILRKSAGLIVVLLQLMRDANIGDLGTSAKTGGYLGGVDAEVTIAKVYEKFRVDIDDEAADSVFLQLVDSSVQAIAPVFFEFIHRMAVTLR